MTSLYSSVATFFVLILCPTAAGRTLVMIYLPLCSTSHVTLSPFTSANIKGLSNPRCTLPSFMALTEAGPQRNKPIKIIIYQISTDYCVNVMYIGVIFQLLLKCQCYCNCYLCKCYCHCKIFIILVGSTYFQEYQHVKYYNISNIRFDQNRDVRQ